MLVGLGTNVTAGITVAVSVNVAGEADALTDALVGASVEVAAAVGVNDGGANTRWHAVSSSDTINKPCQSLILCHANDGTSAAK